MGKPQRTKPRQAPLRDLRGFVMLSTPDGPASIAVLSCGHAQPVPGETYDTVPVRIACQACGAGITGDKLPPPELPPAPDGYYWDAAVAGVAWEAALLQLPPDGLPTGDDSWDEAEPGPFSVHIPLEASFVTPEAASTMVAEAFYDRYQASIRASLQSLAEAGIAQELGFLAGADMPQERVGDRPEPTSLQQWLDSLREPWLGILEDADGGDQEGAPAAADGK